jgi:hypothetical protein
MLGNLASKESDHFLREASPTQCIFSKIFGLISEVFSSRSVHLDSPGSLEQREEYWISNILGANYPRNFPSPVKSTKRKKWKLWLRDHKFLDWK